LGNLARFGTEPQRKTASNVVLNEANPLHLSITQ
jgi:hypothetical protein